LKLGELWRRWQTRNYPEPMLTEAEAIERVRQYAEANGCDFGEPLSVRLEWRALEPGNWKAGSHLVYVIPLGTSIPIPFVEVDASDGKVLAWRSLSR
jgi:hypothetical protein